MNDLRIPIWWLLIAVGFILLMPVILTQLPISLFDFSDKGQIGDTIGGITSPFVGLLSAYLVYRAFIVQVEANKMQSRNNDFGIAIKLIEDVEQRLKKRAYSFIVPNSPKGEDPSQSANAYTLIVCIRSIKSGKYYYFGEIINLMQHIVFLKGFIETSDFLSPLDKDRLRTKAALSFGLELEQSIVVFQRLYNRQVFDSLEDVREREYVIKFNEFVDSTGSWFFKV